MRAALEELCQAYWTPLYAFARRAGHSPEDARDFTQGFFARLLEKRDLAAADPERGKFRTFLLAAFKHFLAHERERAGALKRGGGIEFLPLHTEAEESGFGSEPADLHSPEQAFELRWAAALLEKVLRRLREEFAASGRAALFDDFKGFLIGEPPEGGYAATAARLGMTEGAAKMIVTRTRGRYRLLLRSEIAQTVTMPGEVEEELRHLRAVLSGS
jgi:RNA polymerase sigma-70 factor (ECF subfamily)